MTVDDMMNPTSENPIDNLVPNRMTKAPVKRVGKKKVRLVNVDRQRS